MYQSAGLCTVMKFPVPGMSSNNIDKLYFADFFEKQFEESLDDYKLPLKQIIENLNLSHNNTLNIAGALLFGKHTAFKLPAFIVKCVSYPGTEIDVDHYIDSQDMSGVLKKVYDDTLGFILRNIKRVQNNQGVNSLGELAIPKIVFEEIVANALIHRDYFISAAIRIFIFSDRIEIISPGHLPNNLTIENIKTEIPNIRNPILASFATKILPYRGLGSGIMRAIKSYPDIEFIDDREGNLFKVIIKQPQ